MASTTVQTSTPTSDLKAAILRHVSYSLGCTIDEVSPRELYRAVALAVRDLLTERLLDTEQRYEASQAKRLYYLSMEFLVGRSLENNLINLNLYEACEQALRELGTTLEDVARCENDAALGNGGLGRLAACFIDSLATLGMPGFGYGINYEYGLFKQEIHGGEQVEKPDNWRTFASPWQIERPQEAVLVPLYGRIEHGQDLAGGYNPMWLDWQVVIGVPHDMPIVGYGGHVVNYLRLYSAQASQHVNMSIFNEGDYLKAVEDKVRTETISKVLYPSESVAVGRELRLIQEYFLVACSLRDIVRTYSRHHDTFENFSQRVAIQLNDTHPALSVAELQRILVDEHDVDWDIAWEIVTSTFAYTNHTLLPEALERWPVELLERVLPRHLQIIYEINHRFLQSVARTWPGDIQKQQRMSIIEEGPAQQIRMANLSIVGSHSVNGVAAVHSELVRTQLVPDFYSMWPEKFNNKTNGVTPRRWLLVANPGLSKLIKSHLGEDWITDLHQFQRLKPLARNREFQQAFLDVKRANKERLAKVIRSAGGGVVDCNTLFDVQIKRIHEYKRQLLNLLQIVHEYLALIEDGRIPDCPRTYIFAGKAAPGYYAAKQIIRLINDVAEVINDDPRAREHMRVAFVPDYRVTLAEVLIPATDVSEQISTAGTEASGTGNMKFAMNGALTVGTLDGANIEIREEVGPENIFIFGLSVSEVRRYQSHRDYHPHDLYMQHPSIRRMLDEIKSSRFCPRDPGRHDWVYHQMLADNEQYYHLADLLPYINVQAEVAELYQDRAAWAEKAILNVAGTGKFSSDRTIQQYADEIWGIQPLK